MIKKLLICLLLLPVFAYGQTRIPSGIEGHSITEAAGVIQHTFTGTVTNDDFTQLGSGSPKIKFKKLTGTTDATEGSAINIAHGLTLSKIIGFDVLVTADNGNRIPMSFVSVAEFQFDAFLTSTNVRLVLSFANSGQLLSSAVTVLLTYEE